ncbi:MAG: hypothetical protein J6C08_00175 [Campylobacter sp.]|uniref:hypothetical protein n=1 Tax=Campylobacter sp. TaxID=205 RepID=UPI001B03D095|nr:hypothetical protein [Campylobacter sp.]MBO5062887.1 hypothetical protein [Campylobacter sp.]MBO5062916.1 hypothetical protein [Campylobacter sp.]
MRIVIDTKANAIICPKGFFEEIAKRNEVLRSVGQPEVSHKEEVKKLFEEAIKSDLMRQQDLKGRK